MREEQRVINKIYLEDQKEIDGLQTKAQKRENVQKLVENFIIAQNNELRDNEGEGTYRHELQLSPLTY